MIIVCLTGPYIMEEINRVDKGRCDYRDRSRTASDVGGTVLQVL